VPRLSIIIPLLGDTQQLDDTLVSVLENRPANCEILVVHNRPYHDPYKLGDEVRFIEAERGSDTVDCLNRGLAASRSPVVHVLACGVEVCPGWAEAALRHFGDPMIAAVGAVLLDHDDRRKIVSAGLGYRVEGTMWRLGRGNQPDDIVACQQELCGPDSLAAFYRKSAIESVGRFAAWTGDALAGIDLALALRQAGFRCAVEPQCVAHVGAAAMRAEPAFRCGRNAERLFWRWASSQGSLPSLAGHVALLAGQGVISLWRPSMLLQLVGRACGMIQAALWGRNHKRPQPAISPPASVIGKPHFAIMSEHDRKQKSARVA
jgi:hypothetical protein